MPGKPGQVRRRRRFRHHRAGRVHEPGKERVVVGIDGYQAPAGQHGGDRGLPGARTACDLDSAHHAYRRPAPMTDANEFVRPRTDKRSVFLTQETKPGGAADRSVPADGRYGVVSTALRTKVAIAPLASSGALLLVLHWPLCGPEVYLDPYPAP